MTRVRRRPYRPPAAALLAVAVLAVAAGGRPEGWTGTAASWSDSGGRLSIVTDATNTGCAPWKVSSAGSTPVTYPMGAPIVPGDVLSRECAYPVHATGDQLRATVSIDPVGFTGGDFGGHLDAQVSDVLLDGSPVTGFTEGADGKRLSAVVTVTFDPTAGDSTEDLTTVLNAVTLTATQVPA
jgi:alternate signal-mediated exported protein